MPPAKAMSDFRSWGRHVDTGEVFDTDDLVLNNETDLQWLQDMTPPRIALTDEDVPPTVTGTTFEITPSPQGDGELRIIDATTGRVELTIVDGQPIVVNGTGMLVTPPLGAVQYTTLTVVSLKVSAGAALIVSI